MKLRAMIKVRNNALIEARGKLGMSQKALAIAANVPFSLVCRIEKLDYPKTYPLDNIAKLSAFLSVPMDDIFPEELISWRGQTSFHVTQDVDVEHLLEWRDNTAKKLIVGAPDETVSLNEELTRLSYMIDTCPGLTIAQKAVIRLRYGLHDGNAYTLGEVGRRLHLSREVVRSKEQVAIRKLQAMAESWPLMERANKAVVDDIIDYERLKISDELEPSDKEVALPDLRKT